MYTIGQVSERFDLPVSTLRYYDKEGLFPALTRTSGIRPMYCIHEDDIIAWQRYNGLEFIQCACRFTERAAAHGSDGSSSKRQEVKLLLRELRRKNPDIEKSIFHSIHSVCLDTMVGYKSGGVEHTFADCYRERGEMEKEDAE